MFSRQEDRAELQFTREGKKIKISLVADEDGKVTISGNVEELEIVLPYAVVDEEVVFSPDNPQGKFTLRFEAESFMGGMGIYLAEAERSDMLSAFFVDVGDIMDKNSDATGKLCIWAQNGLGSWSQRHLLSRRQIESTKVETSRK